jgi:hypothetical protein
VTPHTLPNLDESGLGVVVEGAIDDDECAVDVDDDSDERPVDAGLCRASTRRTAAMEARAAAVTATRGVPWRFRSCRILAAAKTSSTVIGDTSRSLARSDSCCSRVFDI